MRGELHARLAAALGARVKAHGIVDIDDLAQVAIDTIREPTQEMIRAGNNEPLDENDRSILGRYITPDEAAGVWQAMVDAER